MIRKGTKFLSFFCFIVVAVFSGLSTKIENPFFPGVALGLTIFFGAASFLLQFIPLYSFKNSKNQVIKYFLKVMYGNPFPRKLRLEMKYEVHLKNSSESSTIKEKSKITESDFQTGQKEVEGLISENDSNRFQITQITKDAQSVAECVGIAKKTSKKWEFYFEYITEGKIGRPNLKDVPMHKGVMRVTVENNKVTSGEYGNDKPSHGTYIPKED